MSIGDPPGDAARAEPVGILAWVVVGFVAGALARAVTGELRGLGCLGTIVLGVLGGVVGGAAFNLATDEGIGEFGLRSMFVAFVGAALLALVFGRFVDPGRRRP